MARAARADDFNMAMLDWWFISPPSVVRLGRGLGPSLGTRTACTRRMHTPHAHCMRTA
jgi:hypothetical protein